MRLHRGIAPILAVSLAAVPALAADYPLAPGQTMVGAVTTYVVKPKEVLLDTARDHDLGFTQLMAANPGVDAWLPGPARRITLPTLYILPDAPRNGIVINLAAWRLFYFPPSGDRVETYPIGIGVIDKTTPLGGTSVVSKEANPTWYPPPSIRASEPDLPAAIPPGPDDPLGAFALHLGWPNYLIHGTNKPDGVGRNVSHGCIRLYPEDIERLFGEVPVGTPVHVVDQAVTAAWIGGRLLVQVYPSKAQAEDIDIAAPVTPDMPQELIDRVTALADDRGAVINWDAVHRAGMERNGLPVEVARVPAPSALSIK